MLMEPLLPEHKEKPYLEQWERVGRWYKKLMEVKHGLLKDYKHTELLDVVYAYFMNVQHLKDWVVGSTNSSVSNNVSELMKKECFVICADFINNHKHFERRESARTQDREASIKHQNVTVSVDTLVLTRSNAETVEQAVVDDGFKRFSPGPRYSWDIVHCGKKYDAYVLARDCYEEWDRFIKDIEFGEKTKK